MVIKEFLIYDLFYKSNCKIKTCLPHVFEFDRGHDVLITELLSGLQSLNHYNYINYQNDDFLEKPANQLGELLATCHTFFQGNERLTNASFLPKKLPFISTMSHPGPEIFSYYSKANMELLKIIQHNTVLSEFFSTFGYKWSRDTLIHGDIKSDNIFVTKYVISPDMDSENSDKQVQIKVVDWEMADVGDPAWDIGSVFQDYLRFWLFSLPITGSETPEQLVMSAPYPLQNAQGAIRSFWRTYKKNANLSEERSHELLRKSAGYCAARLIQTAYESSQDSSELSNIAIYLLQVATNMLSNIDDSLMSLLGISSQAAQFGR